ncbi:MAG TPA: branched-chain amino acid ABC transporter permease [Tepidiformaceae bacterium]|nr:branched-chain amino acid ABC transporter permease [Tepidiformaceae bacterium]
MDLFSQLLANGIINGSSYAALGLGFGLIIGVTGRFHFAYATTYAVTAYAAIGAHDHSVPLIPAILIGLLAGAALGVLIEWFIYRPLEGASPTLALLSIFISALGIVIVGENTIRLWLGSRSQLLEPGFTVKGLSIGNTTFTSLDVVTVCVMWAVILVVAGAIRYTRPGRMVDAVRVNPEMARVVGIDSGHVYLVVFAIGSAVAGAAAILGTMKYAAVPDMGNQPVFIAFVVAFLAGVGSSPIRTAVAGLAIGIIESLSGLWLSSQWSQLVVFGILFIYVAVQPIPFKALLATRTRRAPLVGAQ